MLPRLNRLIANLLTALIPGRTLRRKVRNHCLFCADFQRVGEVLRADVSDNSIILFLNNDTAADIFRASLHSLALGKMFVSCGLTFSSRLSFKIYRAMCLMGLIKQCSTENLTIVFANIRSMDLVKVLLHKFPRSEIILRYYDYVDEDFGLRNLLAEARRLGARIESYSRDDAERYSISYMPNFVDWLYLRSLRSRIEDNGRVLFVGSADRYSRQRFESLMVIGRLLEQNKINFLFYITGLDDEQMHEAWELNAVSAHVVCNTSIKYLDYLDLVANSTCIIDLWRLTPDEGFSYRVSEAVALNIRIITDRENIRNEPFYCPENIFVMDSRSGHQDLLDFLGRDGVEYQNAEMLRLEYWVRENQIRGVKMAGNQGS